ncbi:2-oxo acid dehydrogenase subunit E2 [bacterium]|nr:2-oxo acid dehydrogenase subunit E2 [bacterium]MBU1637811.1 2-oxo acid dehydrogenase subunit E2 [bacterium]
MAYEYKFPDIGEGIHEGKILEWYFKPGDKVTEGESLLKVETDKVVTDIPVPQTGILHSIHGEVDQVIEVGHVIAVIAAEGETVTGEKQPLPKKQTRKEKQEVGAHDDDAQHVDEGFGVVGHIPIEDDLIPGTQEGREAIIVERTTNGRKATASPVARRIAGEHNIDINTLRGSGPGGRVMKEDVLAAAQGSSSIAVSSLPPKPSPDEGRIVGGGRGGKSSPTTTPPPVDQTALIEVEDLSQIRKAIAARMALSKFTAPHSTQLEEVEVSMLVNYREAKNKELAKEGIKLSFLPFVIKALTFALQRHKKLNARLDMDKGQATYFKYYNIGIAVDTEAGLVVPVIKNADKKGILQIAAEINDLSTRARSRQLTLDEIQGGTFTVTNYGSLNGTFGIPVINYPEVAILGVGKISQQPVILNDEIVKGWIQPLSLSFDHRIVDGGDSARFMKDFMAMLRDPLNMLMF